MTKRYGNVQYLTLQKSGCSFTSRVLDTITQSRHNQTYHRTNPVFNPDVVYMINVRNPWDYYVSLWTYNLKTNGPDLKSALQYNGSGKEKYSNPKERFDNFLYAVLDHKTHNSQDNKIWISANKDLGLITYRLMAFLDQKKTSEVVVRDMKTIEEHFYRLMDNPNVIILRQETLFDDLYNAIKRNEKHFKDALKPDWENHIQQFSMYRDYRNVEIPDAFMKIRKTDKDYKPFYAQQDSKYMQQLVDLVAYKDKLIIEYFDYKFNKEIENVI